MSMILQCENQDDFEENWRPGNIYSLIIHFFYHLIYSHSICTGMRGNNCPSGRLRSFMLFCWKGCDLRNRAHLLYFILGYLWDFFWKIYVSLQFLFPGYLAVEVWSSTWTTASDFDVANLNCRTEIKLIHVLCSIEFKFPVTGRSQLGQVKWTFLAA